MGILSGGANDPMASAVSQQTPRVNSNLTSAFLQFQNVIIGTSQFSYQLPAIFTFSQPAITLEAKRLVCGRVHHINIFQVPTWCDS